jgi:hypothetical protein
MFITSGSQVVTASQLRHHYFFYEAVHSLTPFIEHVELAGNLIDLAHWLLTMPNLKALSMDASAFDTYFKGDS